MANKRKKYSKSQLDREKLLSTILAKEPINMSNKELLRHIIPDNLPLSNFIQKNKDIDIDAVLSYIKEEDDNTTTRENEITSPAIYYVEFNEVPLSKIYIDSKNSRDDRTTRKQKINEQKQRLLNISNIVESKIRNKHSISTRAFKLGPGIFLRNPDSNDLVALYKTSEIKKIVRVRDLEINLQEVNTEIESENVWQNLYDSGIGYTGAGVQVGIIDTGVDYLHPMMGGLGGPHYINPTSPNMWDELGWGDEDPFYITFQDNFLYQPFICSDGSSDGSIQDLCSHNWKWPSLEGPFGGEYHGRPCGPVPYDWTAPPGWSTTGDWQTDDDINRYYNSNQFICYNDTDIQYFDPTEDIFLTPGSADAEHLNCMCNCTLENTISTPPPPFSIDDPYWETRDYLGTPQCWEDDLGNSQSPYGGYMTSANPTFCHRPLVNYCIPNPESMQWTDFPNSKVVGSLETTNTLSWDQQHPFWKVPTPNNAMDDMYHGTHVASTCCGKDLGYISGVAPDADVHSLKVCNENGSCFGDLMLAAFEYAIDPYDEDDFENHLDVINMSLGGWYSTVDQYEMHPQVQQMMDIGVISVISAGNNGPQEQNFFEQYADDFNVCGPNEDQGCSLELYLIKLLLPVVLTQRSGSQDYRYMYTDAYQDQADPWWHRQPFGNHYKNSFIGETTGYIPALGEVGWDMYGDSNSIGCPGCMRDAITVGSSYKVSDFNGTDIPLTETVVPDREPNGVVAYYSSRGPANKVDGGMCYVSEHNFTQVQTIFDNDVYENQLTSGHIFLNWDHNSDHFNCGTTSDPIPCNNLNTLPLWPGRTHEFTCDWDFECTISPNIAQWNNVFGGAAPT